VSGREVQRVQKKVERRERSREARAEKVALIENKIKKELLERLKQGTYGEIYNFDEKVFSAVLDEEGIENEEEQIEYIADQEDEVDLDLGQAFEDDEYLSNEDVEDFADFLKSGFDEADFEMGKKMEKGNDQQTSKGNTDNRSNEPPAQSETHTKKRRAPKPNQQTPAKRPKKHLEIEYDNRTGVQKRKEKS